MNSFILLISKITSVLKCYSVHMALSHPYAKAKLLKEKTSLQSSKVFYDFALPALIVLNGLLSSDKLIWMAVHTHLCLLPISERNMGE